MAKELLSFDEWIAAVKQGATGKQSGNKDQNWMYLGGNVYSTFNHPRSYKQIQNALDNIRDLWVVYDYPIIMKSKSTGLIVSFISKEGGTVLASGDTKQEIGKTSAMWEGHTSGNWEYLPNYVAKSSRDPWVDSIAEEKIENKGIEMKNKIVGSMLEEVKGLVNESGAADIAIGKLIYGNFSSAFGKTIVKIPMTDKLIGKFSKKMRLKNEVVQLGAALVILVGVKQAYDHKLLGATRGYIINRLYTILIEAVGMDDLVTLVTGMLKTEESA